MKKIILCFFLFNSISHALFSQDQKRTDLDESEAKKLINKQFGNLMNPQSNNNIGNFASLDIEDAEVNFAGNVVSKYGSVLGIKATGSTTDGFLPIFSNSELNSKVGVEIQYNFLNIGKRSISYDNASFRKIKKREIEIDREYDLKEIEINNDLVRIQLNLEIDKLRKQIDDTLNIKIGSATGDKKRKLIVDSLKLEKKIEQKIIQLATLPSKGEAIFDLDDWYSEKITEVRDSLEIYGFSFGWISIGYGISNNTFRLFDPGAPFNDQVNKRNFATHNVRFQYSYYNKTPDACESFFVSLGIMGSFEDNLSDLDKVEINERLNYGFDPDDRYSTKKFNAYQGEYDKGIGNVSLFSDIYWFLFNDNKGAVHVYPEYKVSESSKPLTNLGAGFLLTFKNTEKEENIINAELYMNLMDLWNNRNSEEKLFIRSQYGIRFTFPINFNSKK